MPRSIESKLLELCVSSRVRRLGSHSSKHTANIFRRKVSYSLADRALAERYGCFMRSLLLAAALATSTLASAQVLNVHTFNTSGHPTQAIWTPDGHYILVTVTTDRPVSSGVEVFRVDGAKIKRVAFEPLGDEPARGILLIPNTRMLAVGLSN